MKPTVLLDVDGVIADFTAMALDKVAQVTGRHYDPSEVTEWEVVGSLPEPKWVQDEVYRLLKLPGVCRDIPCTTGAKLGIETLKELADIVVVTAPFKGSPTWVHERGGWLEEHFGLTKVIHTRHKELVHGDFFIDDKPSHVEAWDAYWRLSGRHPGARAMLWCTPRRSDIPKALHHAIRLTDNWPDVHEQVRLWTQELFGG